MSRFSLLGALTTGMNTIGTLLVVLIMAVILTDVFGRFFFNNPFEGTPEIVAMSIAAIVFLQMPATLRAGRVINVDGLLEYVGNRSVRAEQYLLAVFHVLGGALFLIVTVIVASMLTRVWAGREFYGNIGVFTFPKWPVFAVITLGSAVMAIQYFVLSVQFVRAGRRNQRLIEIDPATKVMS
jgi:TRAP-type mannitol/chloroaromatic compound transport system permease small subunit